MVSYGKGRSSQAGREAEGQLLGRRPAPSAKGHLAGWELPLPLVRDCWDSEGCSWVHSLKAVPLPVSLLLEPNMAGQSGRKKYSHLYFCNYK